jgi:hypothetical protein
MVRPVLCESVNIDFRVSIIIRRGRVWVVVLNLDGRMLAGDGKTAKAVNGVGRGVRLERLKLVRPLILAA